MRQPQDPLAREPVCQTPGWDEVRSVRLADIPAVAPLMTPTSPIMHPRRRSGFTLIELLAVMLLILTVLGMGVPALFASERKSYANQAMSELIRVHQACMAMQRNLATRGDPGIIKLTIKTDLTVSVIVDGSTTNFNPQTWMGMTLPVSATNEFRASISADQFIGAIIASNATQSSGEYSWTYKRKTGFPVFLSANSVNTITFKALPLGNPATSYKMSRTLNIYPLGYAEIP